LPWAGCGLSDMWSRVPPLPLTGSSFPHSRFPVILLGVG
jgi:hypothetical protein